MKTSSINQGHVSNKVDLLMLSNYFNQEVSVGFISLEKPSMAFDTDKHRRN
uniref:Uncharacterized protein n=1 Tax=Anguilla anguilla TaxID=7936 RepID=A0A0E9U231_ANGAN